MATATGTGATPDTRRCLGGGGAEQDPAHREGRNGSGRHGELDQRHHHLHLYGDQQGNAAIAGVVVTDDNLTPGTTGDDFNPAFSGGDTDSDGLLDVGETWTYTASASR